MSKKLLFVVGTAVAALVAFGAIFAYIASEDFNDDHKLRLACGWLEEGRWDLASEMAEDLKDKIDTQSNSCWHYVSGVAKLLKIKDDLDNAVHRQILLDATKHLDQSRELGFPVGLTGKGLFYLGFCQFHTYKWDAAIQSLDQASRAYPQCRSQAFQMMIQAQLRKSRPDLEAIQKTLALWESVPGKSASESARTFLCQAQLAFKQRQFQKVFDWLSKIDPNLPERNDAENLWALSNIQICQTSKDEGECLGLLATVAGLLKKQIYSTDISADARRQASYLFGKTLRLQKRLVEATGTFSMVRQQNPYSAEAIAASLEEAEILAELGEFGEAITPIRQLLRGIQDISLYNDYWITIDELRNRILAIGDQMRSRSEFERALQLAQQLNLAFPPSYSLRLQAATYIDWANKVKGSSMQGVPTGRSEPTEFALFSKAGDTLERLAQVELRANDYLDIVWSSSDCYQKANQIDSANRMLRIYLQYETRARQPRALIAMGKNLIAAGKWKEGLEPLKRCLEYNGNNPSSYEVRLLSARAYAELEDLDRAIELLSENLWDHDLSPESPIWRESSIELGNLLFQRGSVLLAQVKSDPPKSWTEFASTLQKSHADLLRGIEQLGESVERYPDDSRYFQTRYNLAHSYRLAAEIPRLIAENDTSMADSDRRQQNQQWRKFMEESVNQFRLLMTSLQSARETDSLAPAILRNCYFGEADTLAKLGRYEEAITAYRSAVSYYVNQPEALEALVEVAACNRKLGRDHEAQKALRQAQQVLQRIPTEHDVRFVSTTRGDRKHWKETLDWMSQQYQ